MAMDPTLLAKLVGVAGYMLVLIIIGVVAARRVKDVRDYFAAGKQLGFLSVAFSARATGESAWLLLGLTGMGAMVGIKGFWVVLGETLGVAGAWLLMSRRFKRLTDRYDSITVPDYLESRFRDSGHGLRIVAAFALVIFVTIYVSAQIDATGTAFESFLGWNYYAGAIVGFLVVMAYIGTGGFLAVAWSDVFQGALMFVGLVALPLVGLAAIGGWGEVTARLAAADPNLLSWTGGQGLTALSIASILSLGLIGLGFLGSPQIFVRFIALKDEGEIPRGAATAIIWTILADSGAVLVGMIGRALYVEAGGDVVGVLGDGAQNVLPIMVENLMPTLLVGLYIAIVLSAIMSTIDSLLVVAGSALVRDWYQKVRHPETPDDALVSLSRKATIGIALVAFAVAMTVAVMVPERTVFWFVIFGWSGISATFCPTLILSLFWKKMTGHGALAGMIVGFLSVPFFKFFAPDLPSVGPLLNELSELPPSFALSFFAAWAVSKMGRPHIESVADLEDARLG